MSRKSLGFVMVLCSALVLPVVSSQKKEETGAIKLAAKEQLRTRVDPEEDSLLVEIQQQEKDDELLLCDADTSYVRAKCELKLSAIPLRGDAADVTLAITPEKDVPLMKVSFSLAGVELVSGDLTPIGSGLFETYTSTDANTETNISVCVRFVEVGIHIGAVAERILNKTDPNDPGQEVTRPLARRSFLYFYEDDLARYVTWEELTLKPWWRFDPRSGNLGELVSPAVRLMNQKWFSKMRKIASDIAVWESLCLLHDILNSPHATKEGERSLSDEERATRLLEEGWLEEFRKDPTRPTHLPRNIEDHLMWTKQFREKELEARGKITAKEWLLKFYEEPFDDPPAIEQPERPPEGSLEAKLEIDHPPKLGENARVTLTIVSHWDFPQVSTGISVGRDRNVDRPPGIEIVSWPEGFEIEGAPMVDECMTSTQLRRNERRVYEFVIKVTSEGVKYIGGGVGEIIPIEGMVAATDDIFLDVGEKETKVSETPFPPPPEFWLTPLIRDGGSRYYSVETMRKHMDLFLREEPSLTREEARWLVDKAEYIAMRRSMTSVGFTKLFTAAIDTVIGEAKKMAASEGIGKLEAFKAIVED